MDLRCCVGVVGDDALVFFRHMLLVGTISPGNAIEERIVAVVLLRSEAQLAVRFKKHKVRSLKLFYSFQ